MPCEHAPYATSGPANYCADYDWGPKHTQAYNDPSEISKFGYAYRNCTDYVAWKLASLGVPESIYRGHGDGRGWASVRGVSTNMTPAVGAVAVQTSGAFGHVAFITAVRGSTITVAEYNYGENGTYDTRTGTLSSLGFNRVSHFEPYESGSGTPGTDSVGFYFPWGHTCHLRNALSSGHSDYIFSCGGGPVDGLQAVPLTGDWNGDGKDSMGFYFPWDHTCHLRNALSSGHSDYIFSCGGGPVDGLQAVPLTGDWNGK